MKFRYIKSEEPLVLNISKCTGCGMCIEVCPHEVFKIKEKKAYVSDEGSCMECGACMINCPATAIEVKKGTGCAQAIINSKKNGGKIECGCSGSCC